jgi:hypothetical protein
MGRTLEETIGITLEKKKWGVKMGGKKRVLTRERLPWKPNLK